MPDKPQPPPDQLRHDRKIPNVSEKIKCPLAIEAKLRKEEVIALCLYTGPMYMVRLCFTQQCLHVTFWHVTQTNNIACLPSLWLVRKCVCYTDLHSTMFVLDALITAFGAFGSAHMYAHAVFHSFSFADRCS